MAAPACITEYKALAPHTTIGIGGRARYFAAARSLSDLIEAALFARKNNLPLCLLGRGSNMLIADDTVLAVVAMLSGDFRHIAFSASEATVTAGGAAPLIKLGMALARRGYAGCSFMGVIPGSIGGAVRMNAGIGPGQDISSRLKRARVFAPLQCTARWLEHKDLEFSYRESIASRLPLIILEAVFRLPEDREPAPGQAVAAIKALFARRRATQPRSRFTFGSTFKNPAGAEHSAGWYLEQAGMKALRCGNAMVAPEHANWIVNTGGARSDDVRNLIEEGRRRVQKKFSIALEREIRYLPDDMTSFEECG